MRNVAVVSACARRPWEQSLLCPHQNRQLRGHPHTGNVSRFEVVATFSGQAAFFWRRRTGVLSQVDGRWMLCEFEVGGSGVPTGGGNTAFCRSLSFGVTRPLASGAICSLERRLGAANGSGGEAKEPTHTGAQAPARIAFWGPSIKTPLAGGSADAGLEMLHAGGIALQHWRPQQALIAFWQRRVLLTSASPPLCRKEQSIIAGSGPFASN